jgi:AmmeMemoRadiSam system protein B
MIPLSKKDEENEHSLEMHLPYIFKIFGERKFKLVPLMVGQTKVSDLPKYAEILGPLFMDKKTLFIVSSDFCHWGEDFDY